jgi:hypothetical protein
MVVRLPHFLDNRLTDGGEVVILTRRPIYTQEESWYSFLLGAESIPGHSAAIRFKSTENPMTLSEIEAATFRLAA